MKPSLLAKLDQLTDRLEEVGALLMQENATADMDQYRKLTREHAELEPLVAVHGQWTQAQDDIRAAQELIARVQAAEAQHQALLAQIPLGHLGRPTDVAHAVAYLASPQAAYITGQELHVNGGMFMA